MKKVLILVAFVIASFAPQSFAQLTAQWQQSIATGNLPTWFNTVNSQRNFAYGKVGGKDRLYVPYAGKTLLPILILNAATGDSVGTLDTTGISGGTFFLDDIGVSSDGIIYAADLTVNARTTPFKVYSWSNESAEPTAVITYADSAYRLGDHITVTGSTSDNSLTIWAAANSANAVVKFTTTDHGVSFVPTVIPLNDAVTTGTMPKVCPAAGGDFFVSSSDVGIREYDASGNFVASVAAMPATVGGMAYLTGGSPAKAYVIGYNYTNSMGGNPQQYADVIDVSNGAANADSINATPVLGTTLNANGTGDIELKDNGDGTVTVFVLATNNGIGAYIMDAWFAPLAMRPLWQQSIATDNLPAWFNTVNSQRNFAYGKVGGKDRLYVPYAGKTLLPVIILDAATGDSVGTLDTTGISGGTFFLDDIGVSFDGIVYAADLTVNTSTAPFKVYSWSSESAKPTAVISYSDNTYRLGDHVTVTGSASDNSVTVWAAASGANAVVKFTTADHGVSFTPTVIALTDNVTTGTMPKVCPVTGGDFLVASSGAGIREYDANGNFVAALASMPATVGGMAYTTGGTPVKAYVIGYNYSFSNAGNPPQYAVVFDVSNGVAGGDSVNATPVLGTTLNANGTGDIKVKDNGDGTVTVFVLATNNGIGAYNFSAYFTSAPATPTVVSPVDTTGVPRRATIRWNASLGATGYHLQVASDIAFSSVVADTSLSATNVYLPTPLLASTKYYWHVAASNGSATSPYSAADSFTTGTGIDAITGSDNIPQEFALSQNYPNPFNPTTQINYSIPKAGFVSLKIYNVLGQEVTNLFSGNRTAGNYTATFDASRFASGMYFYRLDTGTFSSVKKMMLVK